jgi:hypothetical protein
MEKRMRKERIVLTAAEKAKSGEFDQGLSNWAVKKIQQETKATLWEAK